MQGVNIKINFFQTEIESISQFKYKLERIHELTKNALKTQQKQKAQKNVYQIEKMLKSQNKNTSQEVKKTKRIIYSKEDEGQQERKILFQSLDNKIDELNDRLYIAEQCVQKAEMIKKKNDAEARGSNISYQMTNVKSMKKQKERNQIEHFIQAKNSVRKEIKRFISLLFDEYQEQEIDKEQNPIEKIREMRNSGLSYVQLRSQIQRGLLKRPHSANKYPKISIPISQVIKGQQKPLISLILTSPKLSQHINSSIVDLMNSIKENNKRMSRLNKLMTSAQQKKQTNTVWEYLDSRKGELSLEQSIAKLELDAVKLNESYEERILSLKDSEQLQQLKKKSVICGEWPETKKTTGGVVGKNYKSLEKKSKQSRERKNRMISQEQMQKKNQSYPHTNDSLSALGRR